tara:strand:- start:2023 stop:2877 length:855 start_codon:yes stop_codon:yes gene_type:complete
MSRPADLTSLTDSNNNIINKYNTANSTGLAVRNKINDIFTALRTISADPGDPAGDANVVPFQPHINTSTNELKICTAVNSGTGAFTTIGNITQTNLGLLPKTGGVLTGALSGIAGTTSAPSFNFGDSGTGLYKKGTNQIGLVANQAEISFLDQNGLTVNNQKEIRFSEQTGNGTNYVALKSPSTVASNLTLTLPAAAPTAATNVNAGAGYALIAIDESGALGWGLAGGAEGAAGSNNQVFWENDQTVTASYSITNGKNAGSFGPITINSGVTVTVGSGETWSVV